MIITVTLNPAVDKTAYVDGIHLRGLNRLGEVHQSVGGKGINVSRTVAALGGDSLACGFAGGVNGKLVLQELEELNIPHDFVTICGQTRTNLKIVEPDGALTEWNELGPTVDRAELALLFQKLEQRAAPDTIFVLAGSVCPGVPADTYAKLITRLKSKGARVLLDADGPLFAAAMDGPVLPDLIKPNLHELAEYFHLQEEDLPIHKMAQMAEALRERGVDMVCVSMGRDGAAFFCAQGSWRAPALPVQVQSTVGAGDAMVGALAYALETGKSAEEGFQLAVAAGTAACATQGTVPPGGNAIRAFLPCVRIEPILAPEFLLS